MDPSGMPRQVAAAARWLFPAYLVVLAFIVFLPAAEADRFTGVVGWLALQVGRLGVPVDSAYLVLEFTANIVLFLPFGLLAAMAYPRLRPVAVVVLGSASSVVIELVQLTIPSRYSTVSDVIANTIGAALGWLIFAAVSRGTARSAESSAEASGAA